MLKEQWTEPPVFLSSLRVCSPATHSWAPKSGSLKITVLINMLCNYCEADRAGRRERERGQGLGQISLKSKLMSCGLQKKNLILILQWLLKACSWVLHKHWNITSTCHCKATEPFQFTIMGCTVYFSSNTPTHMNSASISIISAFNLYLVIWSSILLR